jgi:hypothetical protein
MSTIKQERVDIIQLRGPIPADGPSTAFSVAPLETVAKGGPSVSVRKLAFAGSGALAGGGEPGSAPLNTSGPSMRAGIRTLRTAPRLVPTTPGSLSYCTMKSAKDRRR